jgi:HK97 family phage major capsid protein
MNLQELLTEARKAIAEGRVSDAQKLTEQAKALRDVETLSKTPEAAKAANTGGVAMVRVVEDEADKPFESLGHQLKAVANAYLHPGSMDARLRGKKAVLGANEGQGSDGGFLIQTDFSAEIMRLAFDVSVFASRARRVPIGANSNGLRINAIDDKSRATGSRFGGVRGYWLAEGGDLIGSRPKFREMEWNLKKLGILMYATDELLADTTALGAVMSMAASEEAAFMVDDAIFNGGGAGKPRGIVNSAATIAVAPEAGQAANEILVENIFKMWGRMWGPSRMNAAWFINQDVEPALYALEFPIGTGGIPVFLPPGGLSQMPYATLMGRPIVPTEFNSTLGTAGDILLADLQQYLLVDKGGLVGASSIHVQFLTDQTAFRWIYRVDGQPLWHAPLTPYKGTNTLSPFVTLATR